MILAYSTTAAKDRAAETQTGWPEQALALMLIGEWLPDIACLNILRASAKNC
jgi:hypothetical protein